MAYNKPMMGHDTNAISHNNASHTDRPFPADIYFQTTEFTCGPATLMMAMAALDPAYKPNRLDELKIWRQANLIYMGNGHAGCGPYGLAIEALKRDYTVDIYEDNAESIFKIWTNSAEEAAAQVMLEKDDRRRALRRGCGIYQNTLTKGLIKQLIAENRQLITLTSKDLEGHWVLIHDIVGSNVFIIDPHKASGPELQSRFRTDTGRNFIHYADFDEWTRYGPHGSTVLIAIGR